MNIMNLNLGQTAIEMVLVSAGTFRLGSLPTEQGHRDAEGPVRRVEIAKSFYLGKYQITQGQYKAVMGSSPSEFVGDNLAADQITHREALLFCEKLSDIVGKCVSLPTEAQWEYACRAGTTTRFFAGNDDSDLDRVGWSRRNSGGRVQAVGQKEPNAFGLYDMHGNVWEHCLDLLGDYSLISGQDPVGSVSSSVGGMRGGGWMNDPEYCRSACGIRSNDRFGGAGIRIAINED